MGYCALEEKPLGPVQEYIAFGMLPTPSLNSWPRHTGPLLDASGVGVVISTFTSVLSARETHPSTVAFT